MAVGDTHVFPGFLTPVLTQLSFQSHQLLFSHASVEVRGQNTPSEKLASTKYQIHNHESNTLTTEPSRRGRYVTNSINLTSNLRLLTTQRKSFQHSFSHIMAGSASIYAFLEFLIPAFCKIFSHATGCFPIKP